LGALQLKTKRHKTKTALGVSRVFVIEARVPDEAQKILAEVLSAWSDIGV
jgi:hypothetical protein